MVVSHPNGFLRHRRRSGTDTVASVSGQAAHLNEARGGRERCAPESALALIQATPRDSVLWPWFLQCDGSDLPATAFPC